MELIEALALVIMCLSVFLASILITLIMNSIFGEVAVFVIYLLLIPISFITGLYSNEMYESFLNVLRAF